MTTYEKLLEKYSRIIAGASTESIKQAEIQLARMEPELDFVPTNAAIICELSNPIVIRKFSAIYLNKYSKKIVKQKIIQKSTNAFQQYMNILKFPHLEVEIKALIVSPIEIIINSEPNRALKQLFLAEYVKLVNEAVSQEDFDVNFTFLVFCGHSIMFRDAYNEQVKEIVKNTMGPMIKLTIRLLLRASIEQTLENRDNSVLLLRIIKEYSALLKQYFKRMALLDIECMKILFLPELESLITLALHFNYKENEISSTLFTSIPSEELASKLVNIIKANFVVMLTNFIRLMFTFTKHASLYANNQLYLKIPDILKYFIQSTSSLLQRVPFYQLPHKIMIIQTLDEVLNFFISCLRVSSFYQSFYEYKSELIEHIILPSLSLTPGDIENFYQDGQQFIQNTLQIVSRDLRIPNSTIQNEDPEDQIKQYETLRTLAAQFLNTFCKFQDGTLSHVIDYAIGVLNGTHQGPRSLVFLIICILANQFKERKDIKAKITQIIIQMMKNCPIPVLNGTRKQEDIEYAYLLLTLSKIYFFAIQQDPDIINISYKVGISVIQSPSVNEVHKFFVFQMFNNLAKIDEATQYVHDIISIYNHLLKNMPEPSIHLLESYFLIIKYNTQQLKKSPSSLLQGLRYVCLHIERQVQRPEPIQILLCKCWNVIRQVGQSEDFVPALIVPIEEMIIPLLHYIDGVRNLDFEEDVLMLLTSFIEKGKKVTINQQRMFQIIPKVFYNQYNRRFGHSFYAIQLFIYYGSEVLRQNYQAIQSIIDMSLLSISTLQYNKKPMNETQNCQGVLILQSLILKCGNVFTVDSWGKIITTVQRRLNEGIIRFNLLTSNLYALLSLALIHSYRYFSNEQNEILLNKILSEMRVFNKILYSPKVIIAGLTELLMLSDCEFIWRRFTQILDTVITMLEITSVKKENYFEEDEDQEKQYSNSIIMVKNDLKQLDQFTFFKKQVEKMKLKNLPLLQKSVGELPKTKKEFFTHILRIQRVANEPRQIYKIKR